MSDLNTSILINRQVPEFVREEHPKFISFLEAYYEFLNNTAYGTAKDLRNISDVDETLNEFENQFFNTFLPYVNRNTALSKEKVFKNILPLFLSKGSEKSFQLLFRMLFGEESTVIYPKDQVLRASDGNWFSESVLRLELNVYSSIVGDGQKNTYYLPYVLEQSQITVYVDDVLTTNYEFRREGKKIIFPSNISRNSIVKIEYTNFDVSVLNSRQIVGLTSGATALIENSGKRNSSGLSFYQFFINPKTISGNFENGELIQTDLIVDDGSKLNFIFQTYSDIESIQIVDQGSNYSIGDRVIIRGDAKTPAIAIVDDVTSGKIEDLYVIRGGSGFKVNNNISANGYIESFFSGRVLTVDSSGANSINSISFNSDIIETYLSTSLDATDYNFPASVVPTENLNTVIANALTTNTLTDLGPITSVEVLTTEISSQESPEFIVTSSNLTSNIKVSDIKAIGSINVVSGGSNYQIGDPLIIVDTSFSGGGATGYVSNVTPSGAINTIRLTNGGMMYDKNFLSSINVSVSSASGTGALLTVTNLLGDGYQLGSVLGDGVSGKILSIRILESGEGYRKVPGVDLSFSGDGLATAVANIRNSFVTLSGRWISSDGILSSDEIKLQGLDYYIDYSYVIKSSVEFTKYKSLLKSLLHPAGFVNYSIYTIKDNIDAKSNGDIISLESFAVSGTVSISNGSNTVIGTNTNFVTANTLNIMNVGTVISVNNQVKSVINVVNSSHFTVNTAFIDTANNQLIRILT